MSKHALILFIGALIAALPYLGFPHAIDRVILIVSGAILIVIAFLVRGERRQA